MLRIEGKNKKRLWAAGLILAVLACYAFLLLRVEPMAFDAGRYYMFAMGLRDESGVFSLANFSAGLRGISYALWLYAIDGAAGLLRVDPRYAALTVNFLLFFLCVFVFLRQFVPQAENDTRRGRVLGGAVGLLVLFTLLARFSFTTVLTDFPAFAMCLLGALLIRGAAVSDGLLRAALRALVGGACLYTAYNFRTIYLFSVMVMAVFVLVDAVRQKGRPRSLAVLAAAFLGMLLAALPQMSVNRINYASLSPLVGLSYSSGGASLFVKQLIWGMDMQKYDTYVNAGVLWSEPTVCFLWKPGEFLKPLLYQQTLRGYCSTMLKHPLHFIALYITHFLNMLSPYFTQVYITDLTVTKWPYLFLMYGICYCVVWDIASKFKTKLYTLRGLLDSKFIPVLAVLIPGLAIVPGAVEYRFGMPLFWLIFSYFVWGCSWKQRWIDLKAAPVGRCLGFLAGLAAMICFWVQVLASGPVPLGM